MATKSQSVLRHDAAETVLANLREHSPDLVQQAIMISEELIRVAILWHEQWHEALEDASRSERERERGRKRERERERERDLVSGSLFKYFRTDVQYNYSVLE